MAKRANGVVLYRGPSLIDGAPIVAILTGLAGKASVNAKTGAMLQTWIIREDVDPFDATKTGEDASVCGDCKHRPANGGACYVRVYKAPKSVWKAYRRGRYAGLAEFRSLESLGEGRDVRLGSYGDPAAVPADVWLRLVSRARSHTGYTHQWRRAPALQALCMASVDTPDERDEARAAGWRTFNVRLPDDPLAPRESVCPASHEAGQKTDCATCGACNGTGTGRRGSIAIVAHGALANRYRTFRLAVAMP